MNNFEYKTLIFDENQIINLYLKNEWYAYTNHKETLFEGIKNSRDLYAAYDNDNLVGLIRTVGDGYTIIYIQDILVLPSYHRKGIGSKLLNHITKKYQDVRQVVLMTDISEKTKGFYESMGFIDYDDSNCRGFQHKK